MKSKWFLLREGENSPWYNMAFDEALLEAEIEYPLLRLYEWDRPSVTMGYTQKIEFAPVDQYDVVRRPTGGGFVYHDSQYTYTVVLPKDHWVTELKPIESYNWINKGVMEALKLIDFSSTMADQEIPRHVDRNKMVCFKTPTRYDLLANDEKVAGSAQRRTKTGILHQGSIETADFNIDEAELVEALPKGFYTVFECEYLEFDNSGLQERTQELIETKYQTKEWNYRR